MKAILGIMLFVGVGAGVRAILEQAPWWTHTETYVASVIVSTSSLPEAGSTSTSPVVTLRVVPPPLPVPSVLIFDTTIEQSDTFVVSVANVPAGSPVTTVWSDRAYDLFRVGNKLVGLLGADAKKAAGVYPLEVRIGTTTIARQIAVAKRRFPVTILAVTPELEEAGYTPPAIQSNVVSENAKLNAVLIYAPEPHFSKPFVNPLDRISIVGAYGNIRKSGEVSLQHLGVDLDAAEGTPVYVMNDGVVRLAEEFVNYGKTIVVDHGVGIFSFYLHLSHFNVKVGDRVARGETIARSGNTGYSIGPHLHFSIRIRNASVDPLRFIEAANAALE